MRVVVKSKQSGNVFVAEAEFIAVLKWEVDIETRSFSITAHVDEKTTENIKKALMNGTRPPLVIEAEKVRTEYTGITVNKGTGWEE